MQTNRKKLIIILLLVIAALLLLLVGRRCSSPPYWSIKASLKDIGTIDPAQIEACIMDAIGKNEAPLFLPEEDYFMITIKDYGESSRAAEIISLSFSFSVRSHVKGKPVLSRYEAQLSQKGTIDVTRTEVEEVCEPAGTVVSDLSLKELFDGIRYFPLDDYKLNTPYGGETVDFYQIRVESTVTANAENFYYDRSGIIAEGEGVVFWIAHCLGYKDKYTGIVRANLIFCG